MFSALTAKRMIFRQNRNYLNVATNLAYFELTGKAEDIILNMTIIAHFFKSDNLYF